MRTLEELEQYLVGHWKFDGDFKDTSGNGNHGVPTDIEWKPTERGMKPRVYESSGSNIHIDSYLVDGSKPYAVSFWIKRNKLHASTRNIFDNGWAIHVDIMTDGRIRNGIYDGTNNPSVIETTAMPLGIWTYYVIIYDPINKKIHLYRNGVLNEVATDTTSDTLSIGTFSMLFHTDVFTPDVYIDDLRVYESDVIFDADEVLALYNSTKHAYGVTPAERSFSHDVGSVLGTDENTVFATDMHTKNADGTLVDLSGNDNHGTVYGAVRSNGYFRNGMRFDGVNNFIDCGNDDIFDLTDKLTLQTVVTPSSISGQRHLIAKYYAVDGKRSYKYRIEDGRIMFLASSDGSSYNSIWMSDQIIEIGKTYLITMTYNSTALDGRMKLYVNGLLQYTSDGFSGDIFISDTSVFIGSDVNGGKISGEIIEASIMSTALTLYEHKATFNKLAALPLYQFDFSKYPSNVTVYDDFLPYSSARIASGSFKVDNDKLVCVTDGQIVFRNAHEFDGDEYIKLTINDTVYGGTGTITQGTVTASIEQGSTNITVNMSAGDTLDKIDVQFREPVE